MSLTFLNRLGVTSFIKQGNLGGGASMTVGVEEKDNEPSFIQVELKRGSQVEMLRCAPTLGLLLLPLPGTLFPQIPTDLTFPPLSGVTFLVRLSLTT